VLPAKFREAFLLCEVEGMSYEDAAAVMGCPVKTVSTRLFRARQRFKSLVSKQIKV
jgi:RNA polymerase sigma-70 factor (ECF subfamily)